MTLKFLIVLYRVYKFADFMLGGGKQDIFKIIVRNSIAFKYSYFCMRIRLVCDNVLGKNILKLPSSSNMFNVFFCQRHSLII